MLMKVFNKGQVVIPSHIRQILGIQIGDMIDVEIDVPKERLKIKKPDQLKSQALAGCFSKNKKKNKIAFPSRKEMHEALAEGLLNEE